MAFKAPRLELPPFAPDVITFRDRKTTTTLFRYQSGEIADVITVTGVHYILPRVNSEAEFRLQLSAVSPGGTYSILPKDEDFDQWYSPIFAQGGGLVLEDTVDVQRTLPAGTLFELDVENTLNPAYFFVQVRFLRKPA
jgi:hypothetical protein